MKKILIIGLGLIGGSYARGLTKSGYEVYAIDTNKDTIEYAKEHNIIKDGSNEYDKDFINQFDRIVFALTPHAFTNCIEKYGIFIKDGAIITDVTGVKESVVYEIQDKLKYRVEYIGAHPMAGREVCGIINSDDEIFKGANYIITPTDRNTDEGIAFAREIANALGFRKISILSPKEHDEMIAFLSQLAHCIAVALMTCKDSEHLVDYTGDSFRDLTRIANINENMWTELFLANKKALIAEIDSFINQMTNLRKFISEDNEEEIKQMMKLSTKRRSYFNNKK